MSFLDGDTSEDDARLWSDVGTVSGRGRRREAGLVLVLLLFLPDFIVHYLSQFLPWQATAVIEAGLRLCFLVLFAMAMVRRLHDQDRTGRWVWLLAAAAALLAPDYYEYLQMEWWEVTEWESASFHWNQALAALLLIPCGGFLLTPGTIGPNRWGDDPREG